LLSFILFLQHSVQFNGWQASTIITIKIEKMRMTNQKRKESAADTLFIDVMCPVKTATSYLRCINQSEKAADLIRKEFQSTRIPTTRQQLMLLSKEERESIIMKHVDEWQTEIGRPSIASLVKLCDAWGCSIQTFYDKPLTPVQIKKILQMYIVGQDKYCEQLALAFYLYNDRLKMDDYESRNAMRDSLFVLGPSGSGKTYAIQTLCRLFNAPMVLIHCNSLVPEGIVGVSVSNVFTQFYESNGQDMEMLKQAVVVFDEFDKPLFNRENNGRIMSETLNILDDRGEVMFDEKFATSGNVKKITVPTNKMLFIFTGVCEGLEEVTRRRLNLGGLGYASSEAKAAGADWIEQVTHSDLIDLGFMSEVIGRVQTLTHTVNLTEDELIAALDSELSSPLIPFKQKLAKHGIRLEVSNSGKKAIAAVSRKKQLGVRGMKSVLYDILRHELSHLLSEECEHERILSINKTFVSKTLNMSL